MNKIAIPRKSKGFIFQCERNQFEFVELAPIDYEIDNVQKGNFFCAYKRY